MNCREFEHFWSTRLPDDLPPAARAHLLSCPACAAETEADTADDAALRRIGASLPAFDTDTARAAIRRSLEQRATDGFRIRWRRPLRFAAAGLAAAALAALLGWPAIRRHGSGHLVVRPLPGSSLPGVFPPPHLDPQPEKQLPDQSHPVRPGVSGNGPGALQRRSAPPRPQRARPARPSPRPEGLEEPKIASGIGGTHYPVLPAPDQVPGWWPRPPRNAPGEVSSADLIFLNEGRGAGAPPYVPRPAPGLPLPVLPPVEARKPGSLVVDDLLNLNPILVAAADDSGFQALAAAEPATDPRLQQKVIVHATSERLADLLNWLSRATGVQLVARLEIADERVTLWAEDRPLMEIMRDLRHLYGYYWSRSKQDGRYVYSLWQDAQSRAREEAEIQRLALERHREFQESIWKHVRALHADGAELQRLAQEDPYLVAQMQHPVVRGGYEFFAALAPDQQAQLAQGQTPSCNLSCGEVMQIFTLEHRPGDQFSTPQSTIQTWSPLGDIVTLPWSEMTPAQRAATAAIIRGAGTQQTREAEERMREEPGYDPTRTTDELATAHAMAAAGLESASVTLFRWGDPNWEGLSLRVNVQSGGRGWGIYSNIGLPPGADQDYSDLLRRGQFRLWAGAQAAVNRYHADAPGGKQAAAAAPPATPTTEKPDPILDAPISVTWPLPLRMVRYQLAQIEVLDALRRDVPRPLVVDGLPTVLERPRTGSSVFRWEKRPLRGLLRRLFPGYQCQTFDGAIILRNPDRLRWRLNQAPRAVEEFLAKPGGSYTLDDMALVARSLSPWQIVKLGPYLPNGAIDQTLAARELLELYGELATAQRSALARGLSFSALTPAQQALFLRFAQRQRPFIEPWRFQHGGLRLTVGPSPVKDDGRGGRASMVSRALFAVRFDEDDRQAFPVDLFPRTGRFGWDAPVTAMVGKPFPGFEPITWRLAGPEASTPVRQPALTDARLRRRAEVVIIARPLAEPYVGTQSAPGSEAWARTLADRLRDTGLTVVHVALSPWQQTLALRRAADSRPNLIQLWEPGDENAQPFDSLGLDEKMDQSPTVFLIGSDEIVRAVFEGPDAWDAAAVEQAARRLLIPEAAPQSGPRSPDTGG